MRENGVRWDSMARFQRDNLPKKNRRHLDKALAALEGVPPERWPRRRAVRLEGEPPLYLLLLPEGFRAFIAPTANNGVEIHSLTHEETLKLFHQRQDSDGDRG
jgi:hypothetical protein